MTEAFRGSCLCGVVRFEVDSFDPQAGHCHCSMCRKFHGASFATIASVPRAGFRWTGGEEALKAYSAGNGTTRRFCRHCGSSLTFASPRTEEEDVVEVALGAMDDEIPVRPSAHIYVGSAANWTVLCDDLPKYETSRGSATVARPAGRVGK